jgi:hypothetical protein
MDFVIFISYLPVNKFIWTESGTETNHGSRQRDNNKQTHKNELGIPFCLSHFQAACLGYP